MKKLFFSLSLFALAAISAGAQTYHPLPMDKAVRVGKLSNGLTYYIRANKEPEHQADFYIAQRVGSMQEEEDQRGLAHFLEHMAFNGTEHFKGNGVEKFLESIGMEDGADLNAYTSFDQTVYKVCNAPVSRPNVVDSCLWILKDWANGINLTDEEIDKERGVIHEEWRSRTGAGTRMMDSILPKAFPGQRYGDRLPIGLMSVVDSFPPQVLRDYYKKWYRPDLQAIIVVGDVDVDATEKKIKQIFGKIPKPKNPAPRIYYPVPGNREPIVCIGSDKEQSNAYISINVKHEPLSKEFLQSEEGDLYTWWPGSITKMMGERFWDITHKPNPPFMGASVAVQEGFILTPERIRRNFTYGMSSTPDRWRDGLKTLVREVERARRFGFTQAELDRRKKECAAENRLTYANSNRTPNGQYVEQCLNHFLNGWQIVSNEDNNALNERNIPVLRLQDIDSLYRAMDVDSNMVIIARFPQQEGFSVPTADEILDIIRAARVDTLSAYVDMQKAGDLVPVLPTPGKVVARKDGPLGSTELTLANGVKVVLKPTELEKDQIVMTGFKWGGTSMLDAADKQSFYYLNYVLGWGGLGEFGLHELSKALAGKNAGAAVSFYELTESLSGSCAIKDFKTMLELAYLGFTAPRKSVDEFEAYKTKQKEALLNARKTNPYYGLDDSIVKGMRVSTNRYFIETPENIDSIDYDRVLELYRQRTANCNGLTVMLVGNLDVEAMTPLIEQYLGSLPAAAQPETYVDHAESHTKKHDFRNVYQKKMETPSAMTKLVYVREKGVEYTPELHFKEELLTSVLQQLLTDSIREKEGATYDVDVSGSEIKYPVAKLFYTIQFQSSPENRAPMTAKIKNIMQQVAREGVDEKLLTNYKEGVVKSYPVWQKNNGYWIKQMFDYYLNGFNMDEHILDIVGSLTAKDVQQFAADLLDNCVQFEFGITSGDTGE